MGWVYPALRIVGRAVLVLGKLLSVGIGSTAVGSQVQKHEILILLCRARSNSLLHRYLLAAASCSPTPFTILAAFPAVGHVLVLTKMRHDDALPRTAGNSTEIAVGDTYTITTHSPLLANQLSNESNFQSCNSGVWVTPFPPKPLFQTQNTNILGTHSQAALHRHPCLGNHGERTKTRRSAP